MILKIHNTLFANDAILLFDKDSSGVTFSSDENGILMVNVIHMNLDDVNFDEDDPDILIHVRLMA